MQANTVFMFTPPRLSKYFFFYKYYMMCFQPDLITSLCFRRGKITFTRNLPESGSVLDHALRRAGTCFLSNGVIKRFRFNARPFCTNRLNWLSRKKKIFILYPDPDWKSCFWTSEMYSEHTITFLDHENLVLDT